MEPTNPPPPKRRRIPSSDSFPALTPEQGDRFWSILRDLDTELKQLNRERGKDLARFQELNEQVREHDGAIREIREQTLALKATAMSVQQLGNKVDQLSNAVTQALQALAEGAQQSALRTVASARAEAEQNLKLLELDSHLRRASQDEGRKAGIKWGGGAAVVGTVVAAIIEYLARGGH